MTKRLTLTFDNGPDRTVTPQVLDELDRRGLSATFFVLGRRLDDDRLAIVRDAARRGHRIGNHTYSHPSPLGSLGPAAVDEITRTSERLGDLEAADRLFRPSAGGGVLASGVLNADIVDHLTGSGYTMVLWNAVVEDWVRADGSWVDLALAALDEHDWTLLVP